MIKYYQLYEFLEKNNKGQDVGIYHSLIDTFGGTLMLSTSIKSSLACAYTLEKAITYKAYLHNRGISCEVKEYGLDEMSMKSKYYGIKHYVIYYDDNQKVYKNRAAAIEFAIYHIPCYVYAVDFYGNQHLEESFLKKKIKRK